MAEHHLEFLSLKGGCTGWSESTLVKIPHCWKSRVAAQLLKRNIISTSCSSLYWTQRGSYKVWKINMGVCPRLECDDTCITLIHYFRHDFCFLVNSIFMHFQCQFTTSFMISLPHLRVPCYEHSFSYRHIMKLTPKCLFILQMTLFVLG